MTEIDAAAEASIRSRIGSISGVNIEEFKTQFSQNQASLSRHVMAKIEIHLAGWSPTLHRQPMRWSEDVAFPSGATAVEQTHACRNLFDKQIDIQKKRLEQGISLGISVPMNSWMPIEDINVNNIVLDRDLAWLISKGNKQAFVDRIKESIHNLHQNVGNGLSDKLGNSVDSVSGAWSTGHRLNEDVLYYGDQLWIRAMLPETLLAAIVGHPLGQVVKGLHGRLADRKILGAGLCDIGDDGIEININPDMASVQQILEGWDSFAQ